MFAQVIKIASWLIISREVGQKSDLLSRIFSRVVENWSPLKRPFVCYFLLSCWKNIQEAQSFEHQALGMSIFWWRHLSSFAHPHNFIVMIIISRNLFYLHKPIMYLGTENRTWLSMPWMSYAFITQGSSHFETGHQYYSVHLLVMSKIFVIIPSSLIDQKRIVAECYQRAEKAERGGENYDML